MSPKRVTLAAPAKINLFLRVGRLESSGYHDLETLFQAIELSDRVTVELVEDAESAVGLTVVGHDTGPIEKNLVVRAATAYQSALSGKQGEGRAARGDVSAGHGALRIHLEKNIPLGSGLGGGSSNAAATLLALDQLFGGAVARVDLTHVAANLGSDVPFFLCGSPLALGEGRGERLTPLAPLPSLPVIVALPAVHVSTPEAYGMLDRAREGHVRSRDTGDGSLGKAHAGEALTWADVARSSVNDFEGVVLRAHPPVATACEVLRATRPLMTRLSGSGAACFAVYASDAAAERALAELHSEEAADTRFVLTRTLTTGEIR